MGETELPGKDLQMIIFNNLPEIMTREDVAKALCIGRDKSYEIMQSGKIKVLRFGKVSRVRREDFIDYVKSCTQKG